MENGGVSEGTRQIGCRVQRSLTLVSNTMHQDLGVRFEQLLLIIFILLVSLLPRV